MRRIAGRRGLTIALTAIAVAVATVWGFSYHTFEFKGGIGIRDTGFFSYPRYHAQLGELPLWKDGEYQFDVQGLPPEQLDLSIAVLDANSEDRQVLVSLPTSIAVSIVDNSGKETCSGDGRLSDAATRRANSWVLESSGSHASFWHIVVCICHSAASSRISLG